MVQHNMEETLQESLAQARTGTLTHVREILGLTEQFSNWVSMNDTMKQKVQREITGLEHLAYKAHMGAMMIAMHRSEDQKSQADEFNLAAGIERLKALNVLTGATMRAFPPQLLVALTPVELEAPEFLTEIKELGLGNMARLAALKP